MSESVKYCEEAIKGVERENAKVMIFGLPYQGTVNTRPGSVKGPQAIRLGSRCIESYSPFLGSELSEVGLYDDGDIPVKGKGKMALESMAGAIWKRLPKGVKPVFFGGDHSVSYSAIKALSTRGEKFSVVHLDAHPDSQDTFEGDSWSYANVIRRSKPFIHGEIYQLGIRTSTREELEYAKKHHKLFLSERFVEGLSYIEKHAKGKRVYVTFDIDVVDPSLAPGTSNPVCGGLMWDQIQLLLSTLKHCHVIGLDMVEVAPNLDPSGLTQIVAAEIVRDAILSWWA